MSFLVLATRFPGTREKVKAFIIGMIILIWAHFFSGLPRFFILDIGCSLPSDRLSDSSS
jgi:hypothetical protein